MSGVILGLDVGRARIGVARAERGSGLAFGRGWLERHGTRADVAAVKALAEREGAALVVVGLPRPTRGADSPQTALARGFAGALANAGLQVALEDERFTTALAERRLQDAATSGTGKGRGKGSGKGRAKGAVDEASAIAILESYLARTAGAGDVDAAGAASAPDEGPAGES